MAIDITRERIRGALASVLYPLARILLRCGVGYSEFAELAKHAYVAAASGEYGAPERPTISVTKVAELTGLPRKEVSRIRHQKNKINIDSVSYRNLHAEVLHCWFTNPLFLDEAGHPRTIPFSTGKRSFSKLVSLVSQDLSPRAILHELKRTGAVGGTSDDKLRLLRREYIPDSIEEKAIEGLQYGLRRLTETIFFNSEPKNKKSGKFQRIVHTDGIPASDIEVVQDSLTAILATFATRIDDYLASYYTKQLPGKVDNKFTYHVGVGLYYFDGRV